MSVPPAANDPTQGYDGGPSFSEARKAFLANKNAGTLTSKKPEVPTSAGALKFGLKASPGSGPVSPMSGEVLASSETEAQVIRLACTRMTCSSFLTPHSPGLLLHA